MTDLRTPPVEDGDILSARVHEHVLERPLQQIHVLVAGCGWGGPLDLGDHDLHVTGVETDAPELHAHTRLRTDLDTWRIGDLRTVPLPPRAFDIVYAAYLLDRVPHAELVLDRILAALRPGGLLLVRMRDRATACALLDRILPLRLLRSRSASVPPAAMYDPLASLQGMRWYCVMRGLVISEEHTSRDTMTGFGRLNPLVAGACRLVSLVSGGRLTAAHSDVTLVIRKLENQHARVL